MSGCQLQIPFVYSLEVTVMTAADYIEICRDCSPMVSSLTDDDDMH